VSVFVHRWEWRTREFGLITHRAFHGVALGPGPAARGVRFWKVRDGRTGGQYMIPESAITTERREAAGKAST